VGLLEELISLRKGRGVNSVGIDVGPTLRELCGIESGDVPGVVRRKLVRQLGQWADRLPPDAGVAARVALAMHPEAQQRFLSERTQWLAHSIERDDRTARRRMDEALRLMADLDAKDDHGRAPVAAPPLEEHYIAEHWALVRLDQPTRETYERRVIVANVNGLEEVDAVLTLPRDRPSRPGAPQLDMDVLYGAAVVDRVKETDTRFRYRLRLPTPLNAGQAHEYSIVYRIPPRQFVRPHYVFIPHRRCNALTLRVRFPLDRLPADVRRVDHGYLRDLDDEMVGDPISPDGVGELLLTFTGLVNGMAYGARWRVPDQEADYPPLPDA
jgi:hypothetical protein